MGKIKNKFKKIVAQRAGFTLLELVIVIAIMAVLSTVGFVSLSGYRGKQNLKKTTDEVVAAIVGTQKRSISQDAGKRWNVRFSNATSTGSQFIVFSGLSYATSAVDRAYGLSRGMQFSEPSTGNLFDATFAPITGTLPSKKIISIVTGKGDGFVGDIVLNTAGRVDERLESGLVGYWHFDEGMGTSTYDASGNGNIGTLTIGATGSQTSATQAWANGVSAVSGGSLNFDGTDDYITVSSGSSLNLTSSFTFAAWIYPITYPTEGMIFNKESSYEWATSPSGTIKWAINNTVPGWAWVDTGLTAPLNQWTHFVITYDGVNTITYKNGGAQIYATSSSGKLIPNAYALRIAARGGPASFFSGKLDEIKIYNRALSATEILNMYNDLK